MFPQFVFLEISCGVLLIFGVFVCFYGKSTNLVAANCLRIVQNDHVSSNGVFVAVRCVFKC